MIDSTITLAIIISLCALISAPITAIINNHYQLKLRNLELKSAERQHHYDLIYEKKYDTYKNFIESAQLYKASESDKTLSNVLSACQSAMLLSDSNTTSLLVQFQANMPSDENDYSLSISEISESFNCELTELSAKMKI